MTQIDQSPTTPPSEQFDSVEVLPPIEHRNQAGYHWLKKIGDDFQYSLEFQTGEPQMYICAWWSARCQCWQDPIGAIVAVLCPASHWEYVAPAIPPEK